MDDFSTHLYSIFLLKDRQIKITVMISQHRNVHSKMLQLYRNAA